MAQILSMTGGAQGWGTELHLTMDTSLTPRDDLSVTTISVTTMVGLQKTVEGGLLEYSRYGG